MTKLVSFEPWDISTVNLNWYAVYATGSSLQTTGFTFDNQTYPDLFTVQASDGSSNLELEFLGSGITQDASGNITGGTVNAVIEGDRTTSSVLWYADGFSIDAVSIYNAALTPSNQDEINLIQTALSGSDTIIGGQFNDTISGYSGNDTLTGGGGNDMFLDTKAGHNGDTITDFHPGDAIIFSDATLSNFTFSQSGNTLTYSGGSITLGGNTKTSLVASTAAAGGVELLAIAAQPTHAAHNDFNGDGKSDVLWRNDDGALTDWLGTASGGFSDNSGHLFFNSANGWQVAGTGDFNGDGRADILFRNSSGVTTDWLGNADGSFTDNGAHALTGAADNSWHIAITGDFNGDGIADILWRNSSSGYLTEWLGTSTGGFTDNSANAATGAVDYSWEVVGAGDFNGDGKADILWRNGGSGYVTEWLGTSNGGFTSNQANAGNGSADSTWTVVGTGDFNGDGHADILWRNGSTGYVTEWLGTSTGGFTDNAANAATGAANSSWSIVSIADFNGDGKDDVLWRNSSGYTNEWLGTSTGGFSDNAAHAATGAADNTWNVQDPSIYLFG